MYEIVHWSFLAALSE